MIFVTVGAQMPFDRLVGTVDAWAGRSGRGDVFAQIGETALRPRHLEWTASLGPDEYGRRLADARVVVAHAGMGSIITAAQLGKPILVMPRREALRETRNDHQVATAERFREKGLVHVAMDEEELAARLEEVDELTAPGSIEDAARPELLSAIRDFLRAS